MGADYQNRSNMPSWKMISEAKVARGNDTRKLCTGASNSASSIHRPRRIKLCSWILGEEPSIKGWKSLKANEDRGGLIKGQQERREIGTLVFRQLLLVQN